VPVAAVKVFISYAWEDEAHSTWVEALASRLTTEEGLHVELDRWSNQPGDELPLAMEKGVRDSRFVLLICTPVYKARFDERAHGVGYEARLIAAEILAGGPAGKFVPVRRAGDWPRAAPSVFLGDTYIDLSGNPFDGVQYQRLVDVLKGRSRLPPLPGRATSLFEGPAGLPIQPVPHFVGREDETKAVCARLLGPAEKAVCIVASGVGGIGKSALAQQVVFVAAPRLFPDGAAWLDGDRLPEELAREARRFGWSRSEDPKPEQAVRWLCEVLHDRAVLLVVDNFDPSLVDTGWLPFPGGRCRTLVTSRAALLSQSLAVPTTTLAVDRWPAQVGRQYLCDVVSHLAVEPDADVEALSEFVGGLPLALRLVARALNADRDLRARSLLANLEREPLDTLESAAGTGDRGLVATFQSAWRKLTETQQGALQALSVCAQRTRAEVVAEVARMTTAACREALNRLADMSLAEHISGVDAPWGLHDVVRMFTAVRSDTAGMRTAHLSWAGEQARALSDPRRHEELDRVVPEVLSAIDYLLTHARTEEASELFSTVVRHLIRCGHSAIALETVDRLVKALGSDSPTFGARLSDLALCYQALGEIQLAIETHTRSLEVHRAKGDLKAQAANFGNLGICHRIAGDFFLAIQFHERSLDSETQLGRRAGQATQLGNLGACYQNLGNIAQALEFHSRALTIHEEIEDLEGQAVNLSNLGICNEMRGTPAEAIIVTNRALDLHRKTGSRKGEANNLTSLGNSYRLLGDPRRALDHFQQALAIENDTGNAEGQAGALGNIGLCHRLLGRVSEAIDFHERSLRINEKIGRPLGEAICLANLAACYKLRGDLDLAIDYFQRALKINQRIARLEGIAATSANLGFIYQETGRREEARAHLTTAMETLRRMGVAESHRGLADIQDALAEL